MPQVSSLQVFNALTGLIPCEGAKVLPYLMDFSQFAEFDFDFTQQFNNGVFTAIQTAYVDNTSGNANVTIEVNGTGQTITVPVGSCGYYTLLSTTPPKFQITSGGNGPVMICFLNFYVPPVVWLT